MGRGHPTKGDNLDEVLRRHAEENPTSLKLVTENRLSRVVVTSINELENHDDLNYEWHVFKFQDDDLTIDGDNLQMLRGINIPVEEGEDLEEGLPRRASATRCGLAS